MNQNFTKYERARILGARALQIAMNAPLLIKIAKRKISGGIIKKEASAKEIAANQNLAFFP